ncbi:DsbE family thiol:disulfide interchange protein [Falsiroseomonas oryzae]|uniref:DsbE family thiol:disulfide interchange protein n=1 Tax=Falsiroseomonas oryzae TaxID=2766473 RepID=UPI0022EA272D|nr:DsbE family thiol:disulfide interchange protein [Roseomonas sp. MO-31]
MTPATRRILLFAPFAVAAAGGVAFYGMLQGMRTGEYNPRGVPSALIGRSPPDFTLPPLEGVETPALTSADLQNLPGPVIVNFWASWCVPCIIEHPQLMRLHREGVPVFGIAYKDRPEDSLRFLRERGNPYRRLSRDEPGRVAIDWGVYGVPETYLLDRQGIIRWRFAGPITQDVLDQDIRPLLRRWAS